MPLRFYADENISKLLVDTLRAEGHGVAWVAADAPSTDDEQVLEQAQVNTRIVITFDKDFGELAFRDRIDALNGVILLRLRNQDPEYVTTVVMAALSLRSDWAGHFSVIEDAAIRMTDLPT